jgi:hypothetical protein
MYHRASDIYSSGGHSIRVVFEKVTISDSLIDADAAVELDIPEGVTRTA